MRATYRLVGCLVLALTGCRTTDLDGLPAGATPLALEHWQGDRLRCKWLEKDCADWYRLEVPERGELVIRWQASEESAGEAPWEVVATDAAGNAVGSPTGSGTDEGGLAWHAEPGSYLVAVRTPSGEQSYRIRAEFTPEPPPPPPTPPSPEPRVRWLRSEVLEVEGTPGQPRAVLLDRGRGEGVASGQRGRLLDGEHPIASLRVVDVYDEGCRALIDGALESSITPKTTAEIEIPSQE